MTDTTLWLFALRCKRCGCLLSDVSDFSNTWVPYKEIAKRLVSGWEKLFPAPAQLLCLVLPESFLADLCIYDGHGCSLIDFLTTTDPTFESREPALACLALQEVCLLCACGLLCHSVGEMSAVLVKQGVI